jgi:hypothetical protein
VDYRFVSEFEPLPDVTSDYGRCVAHSDNVGDLFAPDAAEHVSFPYSSDIFAEDATRALFRDYILQFVLENGEAFIREDGGSLSLLTGLLEGDALKFEVAEGGVGYDAVRFEETSITFGGNKFDRPTRVVLFAREPRVGTE